MGTCIVKSKRGQISNHNEDLCRYPRDGSVTIKYKNYIGRVTNQVTVDFKVTEPSKTTSKNLKINETNFFLSLCVLPGLDVRHTDSKKCQDNSFFAYDENSLLIGLLDGHGPEGEKIAEFCEEVIVNLYTSCKTMRDVINTKENPIEFIQFITTECDKELGSNTGSFNANASGW